MLEFVKATATGNDFVYFDARDPLFDQKLRQALGKGARSEIAKRLCDRHFGIGADGVVFLQKPHVTGTDFSWDFYNSDGSSAEMCGNAARGFAVFVRSLGVAQDTIRFSTLAGIIEARELSENFIEVLMSTVETIAQDRTLSNGAMGDVINTGVPHVVLEVTQIQNNPYLAETARQLRHDASLGPAGANVTFRQVISPSEIFSVTFERGVEDFTLACGTGAVAAAHSHGLRHREVSQFKVTVPGGTLEVLLNPERTRAKLRGPAQIVFTGQIGQGWMK